MNTNLFSIGVCPKCGGNVVKTLKGFRCVNSLGQNPTCDLAFSALVGNRKMTDDEMAALLARQHLMLDGFSTKDGKVFSTVLSMTDAGQIIMNAKIGKCPVCGGDLYLGMRSVGCSNFRRQDHPCNFTIWRNTAGHYLTLDEIRQIVDKGVTEKEILLYNEDGSCQHRRLGLSPQKDKVIRL